ncbi:MAG: O-methyltransferase [Limisphaerales bacterium]
MNSIRKAARLGFRLLKIGATNPRRLSHVLGAALAASDEVVDRSCDLLCFPSVHPHDLLPESGYPGMVRLALFPKSYASISMIETASLILLMKKAGAGNVFEFGTFKGISVTQFALNLPADSLICTLDLPDEMSNTKFAITDPGDLGIAIETGKGSLVPPELRPRVTFIQQDSAALDISPYAGRMDFVFVDGAHNYDYIKNDSEKAWQMLRNGGIIAWHDCRPQDPDVVRYLLNSAYQPTRILGTTVAFATRT